MYIESMKKILFFLMIIIGLLSYSIFMPVSACIGKLGISNFENNTKYGTVCLNSRDSFDLSSASKPEIVIPANLYLPKNQNKKVPLLIMSHGAGGIFNFHYDYKDIFLEEGYAVLIIDHFFPRGISADFTFEKVTESMMMNDVLNAIKIMRTHPDLDGRIGYIGWSKGGIGTILLKHKNVHEYYYKEMLPVDFYIGIYTYCGFESKEIEFSDVPLLLISGKQDKITPANYCRNFAKNVKKNTEYHELKYANHSFDNYTFYFGGYLPWQPYLKSNNNECRLTINEDLKTVNINDTHDLATYESRKKFLAACTDKGAAVSYDKQSSKTAKKIVLDFIAKNFK